MTKVWAHRGASGYAPENTLEAFALAAEMGADAVELDVQMTRDGELVVLHDETTDRVSGVSGWVKDFSLAELKRLSVNRPIPGYRAVQIPTLREVYELLKPTGLEINVELKTGIVFYPQMEEKVLGLAAETGMEERIWYSSFNHYTLRRLRERKQDVRLGMLYADGLYEAAKYAEGLGVDALHPALCNVQYPDYMEKARQKQLRVHVWTVNEECYLRQMAQLGVDAVITNYPDRAREVLGRSAEL